VAGKVELFKDDTGTFRFRLKAANGQVIVVSNAYLTKAGALSGIDSLRRHAPSAQIEDQTF
jgi:uncharacterized protein YegP (UPF0339 family)